MDKPDPRDTQIANLTAELELRDRMIASLSSNHAEREAALMQACAQMEGQRDMALARIPTPAQTEEVENPRKK